MEEKYTHLHLSFEFKIRFFLFSTARIIKDT
jgi:hypothetical protein